MEIEKNPVKFHKRLIIDIDEEFHYFLKERALSLNMTLRHYVLRSLYQQIQLEKAKNKEALNEIYQIYLNRLRQNFETKYEVTESCWLWKGCLNSSGYGNMVITMNGKRWTLRSHRVSYALYHNCPEILFETNLRNEISICHTCDERNCVNPHHLVKADHLYNMQDAARKFKFAKKLTGEDVIKIKQLINDGKKDKEIAEQFSVKRRFIGDIRNNKTWKHVTIN
jgi:hypothetical protein